MSNQNSNVFAHLIRLVDHIGLNRQRGNRKVCRGVRLTPWPLLQFLGAILLAGLSGLTGAAQAGEAEDLVTGRLTNPLKYQVIWEDFNISPAFGLWDTQKFGWGIYGVGSAVGQVGAALIGAGELGEGNGTIQILSGTSLNNETAILPMSRIGYFPAYVTRLQPTRQDFVLATRVSFWNANQRQFVGLEYPGLYGQNFETYAPAFPQFYWDGTTWRFRAGHAAGVNIPLTVPGGDPLDFHDLLASSQAGVLKLYVDEVLVSTTTSPYISTSDMAPAMGVKTKLGGVAAAMGVDYFFWATERNPP